MRTIIPTRFKRIPEHAKRVFKGVFYEVYQWDQPQFDGSTATFEMLRCPDTVWILAIKDNKLVILDEEQPGTPRFFGIPGGSHDNEAETELQAAQREMVEETGMQFAKWKLLRARQANGLIEHVIYLYLAYDYTGSIPPEPGPGEKIEVQLQTLEEARLTAASPKTRYIPLDILEGVDSLQELTELPEFTV